MENNDDDDTFVDEPTRVVDGIPSSDLETPDTMPRCIECGNVVFFDDFDKRSLASFPPPQCVRSKDARWHWCSSIRKLVQFFPEA